MVPKAHPVHDAPVVEYATAPRTAPVAIAPAPPERSNATPARPEVAPPERTIHVRIGAIEINGAEPPQAPAAPPAAVTPPPGFDDFADLRSYAPWPR